MQNLKQAPSSLGNLAEAVAGLRYEPYQAGKEGGSIKSWKGPELNDTFMYKQSGIGRTFILNSDSHKSGSQSVQVVHFSSAFYTRA